MYEHSISLSLLHCAVLERPRKERQVCFVPMTSATQVFVLREVRPIRTPVFLGGVFVASRCDRAAVAESEKVALFLAVWEGSGSSQRQATLAAAQLAKVALECQAQCGSCGPPVHCHLAKHVQRCILGAVDPIHHCGAALRTAADAPRAPNQQRARRHHHHLVPRSTLQLRHGAFVASFLSPHHFFRTEAFLHIHLHIIFRVL
jgi:hypothetical protein